MACPGCRRRDQGTQDSGGDLHAQRGRRLYIVVPFGDKRSRGLRPTLAIAPPAPQTNANPNTLLPNGAITVVNGLNGGAIDLDGTFALYGAMQPLPGTGNSWRSSWQPVRPTIRDRISAQD